MQNKKTRATVEFLACAVIVPHVTPSVLTNRDEEMTDTSHRTKVQRTDSDDYEWVANPVTESQRKKIAEDQSDKILQKMAELFQSVEKIGSKMDSSVITLEDKMNEGSETEAI